MNATSRRNLFAALPVGALALGTTQSAQPANTGRSLTAVVNNFAPTAVPTVGGLVGTLSVSSFQVVNGVLSAIGRISGNVLNGAGAVVGSITQGVTVPLQVTGSCEILSLTLCPLDLDLLGLEVHLNQVALNITAVPVPGLLCAVANLVNGGGPLSDLLSNLVSLLNQILAAL